MERYRILANGKLIATAQWYGQACAIAYDYKLTITAREPFKRAPRVQVIDHLKQVLREY